MKLRIHHFYDIIRDFGIDKPILPHPYGHAYHTIAEEIHQNSNIPIQLVISCDSICKGCNQLKNNSCVDIISHRNDYSWKEEFNNHIDNQIIKLCALNLNTIYTPITLCEFASIYIAKMEQIYFGNDINHTQNRKRNFIAGLKYYSIKHKFPLSFLELYNNR
jgi:hypothetical protein